MKKVILILSFSLLFIKCLAPSGVTFAYLPTPQIIAIFGLTDPLAHAVAFKESSFRPDAENDVSGARGLMQITKVMIREVNRILKLMGWNWPPYTWDDAFNPKKSIDMWYIYQNFHNPEYDYQKACKGWFGSGVQYDGMVWQDYYSHILLIVK